jgi:hypothetical protein
VSYAFSASNTPFGPFAEAHRALSFSQADAAARAAVLTELSLVSGILGPARSSMARLLRVGGGTVSTEEHETFVHRWNHATSECTAALRYASLHSFSKAMEHVMAARHGADAITAIVKRSRKRVTKEVRYTKAPATGIWLEVLIAFAILLGVLGFLYRRYIAGRAGKFKLRTN